MAPTAALPRVTALQKTATAFLTSNTGEDFLAWRLDDLAQRLHRRARRPGRPLSIAPSGRVGTLTAAEKRSFSQRAKRKPE
jgi:hypothetical protein